MERLDEGRLGTGSAEAGSNRVRYVCIPGSPYTGSTLLGLLLDAHPDCASIGAATGLTTKADLVRYVCSCGARFLDCPFWTGIEARTAGLGVPISVFSTGYWSTHVRMSGRRWLNGVLVRSLGNSAVTAARDAVLWRAGPIRRRVAGARRSTWSLARAVLDETGASVFIDTARDHQRPKYLAGSPGLDVRVIHLIRDPRGNTASIVKHTGVDVATAARQWKHYNVEADRIRELLPEDSWLRIHYEELCRDPGAMLERIARFVGVDPRAMPRDLAASEHHIIGNSMRLRAVGEIREDLTWRGTLRPDDLRIIGRIAGSAAHRFGYAWP